MTPKERYRELTEKLLEDEAWGTLSEAADDAIREEMDSLWWAMTEDERADADSWLAEQRARAPIDLGLIEAAELDPGPTHRRPVAA